MNNSLPPILAIGAYSGAGKTTLLKQLIPLLKQRQVRVGLIKHTHHNVDVDIPGKDSYELRKAGADQTLVASVRRWALMTETPAQQPLDLRYLASRFDISKVDLILVEGFKHEPVSKIIFLFRLVVHQWAASPVPNQRYSEHRTTEQITENPYGPLCFQPCD